MNIAALLSKMLAERSDLRQTTRTAYRVEIAKLGAFMQRETASLQPAELERWAGSDQRRRRAIRSLKALLNWATRYGYVDANPVSVCRGPRIRTLTQRGDLRDAWRVPGLFPGVRDRALVMLLLDAGVRAREAVALNWDDIDLEAGTVRIERSVDPRGRVQPLKVPGSERELVLTPPTLDMLRQLRPKITSGCPVFRNRWGTRLDFHNWHSRVWRPALQRAGISLRVHDLRHCCATALVQAHEELTAIAGRLGHASCATTMRFYIRSQTRLSTGGAAALAARLRPDA